MHDKPVPEDGNCTATGAHLDPYERGQKPACNPLHRETCEVGDLSGKWGSFTGDIETQFADLWTSTKAGEPGFFGNRSITLHTNNGTRITCANFKLEKGISGGDEGTDGGYGGGKNNSSTDDSSHTQTSTEEETSTKPPKGDATKGGDSANTNEKPGATKPSASDPSTAPPRNTGGTGSGEFSGASQVTLGSSAVLGAVVFIAGWFL